MLFLQFPHLLEYILDIHPTCTQIPGCYVIKQLCYPGILSVIFKFIPYNSSQTSKLPCKTLSSISYLFNLVLSPPYFLLHNKWLYCWVCEVLYSIISRYFLITQAQSLKRFEIPTPLQQPKWQAPSVIF